MPDWIESLSKVLPGEKVYDDALAPAAKQLGLLGEDAMKAGRLILAPLQVAAHFQDRLERMLKRVARRVPEERRIEVPPQIAGPALSQMRYLEERSELWEAFEQLLTKAMDRDTIDLVHPAFVQIVAHLSADEARLLRFLRTKDIMIVDELDLNSANRRFENQRILTHDIPENELSRPKQFELYVLHLTSLGLALWPITDQTPVMDGGTQTGIKRNAVIQLTDFGRMFADACAPPADERIT